MKKLFVALAIMALFSACKEQESTAMTADSPETVAAESVPAKEGHGKIELKVGSQTLVVEGKCGGVTNTGEMIIAVQDQTVAAKVFTISFNTKDYPKAGKTYTIKKSDFMSEGKKPDTDVYIGFSEVTQKNQMDWSSDDASGTLKFDVNGNEIQCEFNNIKLQPSAMYNKGEFNHVGTASGKITLYKN
ncbi:hypothetical protein [Flavobacterium sp.]|uniref:hypothetical protein n=1 Tax=Flavobacterium sp. TaxID=239 RepID=UPI0039E69E33